MQSEEFHFIVKSTEFNDLEEKDMKTLASMGNRRFNAMYMARFIANDWDLLELLPHLDGELRSKRRVYVQEKYVNKRWLKLDEQCAQVTADG